MSHHVALKKLPPWWENLAVKCGAYYYVLKDRSGKVRDWTPASDAKDARKIFGYLRRFGIPEGYTVQRRGLVELP